MKSNSTYHTWIDLVRIFSMFGVVLLHVAAPLTYDYGKIPLSNWWIANIYDSIVRVCVPIFFMISGYLLLRKTESFSVFLSKRVKKVVIPLILWSIIYLIWSRYIIDDVGISFRQFLTILIYPASVHLWFLYAIIGIYLYLPILRIIVQNSNIHQLYYFIGLWLIAVSFIPYIEKLSYYDSNIDLLMISGYGGYFILGYLLHKTKLTKKMFFVQILVFILMIVFTAICTFYLSDKDGIFNDFFYKYLNWNIILLSISAFYSLRYIFNKIIKIRSEKTLNLIKTLSSTSLGIYLIHPIILHYLDNNSLGFSLSAYSGNPIYFIPITTTIAFLLSFLMIWIFKRVTVFRFLIP